MRIISIRCEDNEARIRDRQVSASRLDIELDQRLVSELVLWEQYPVRYQQCMCVCVYACVNVHMSMRACTCLCMHVHVNVCAS